ncbi:MAG: tRNA 2-thiouridine(34) synthase MnmA [Candidatus Thioglobus sp.]|jgi:tRNA-specific 2-thiouridylase|nr:tRNA 2-thiouridine(34) synthase MnmA [Candidatus Thioglobus sp.]
MATDNKIIVGLSGGVDSSVAAFLLLEKGYEVEALFMKNWDEDDEDEYCSASEDLADAQQVADQLGIKLHTVNFSHEYWEDVFEHFLSEHKKGRTPNPDVLCNQRIKFKAFLDYAKDLGAKKIATGHYARIAEKNGKYLLKAGLDGNKDQSYFLHLLNQEQLSQSLFPLGEIDKQEVRKIAKNNNFLNADKKDSTGICFIGERPFSEFLTTFLPKEKGDIVDQNDTFIKHHDGLPFYTIGQRKGLEIGGGFSNSPEPWFVADKVLESNKIVVVQGDDALLYHNSLIADDIHWVDSPPIESFSCSAKIRYRQASQICKVSLNDDQTIKVNFNESQRAITPGQSVVFYDGDVCLGGSVIKSKSNE